MAEITAITPQKKDKSRCNIELDGRFFCGMKLETVMKNHLKAGMSVDGEYLARLQLESEKLTAFDKALTHITVSMKTEKQIRDYLTKKGYLPEVLDFVVEKMKSYGYLDDAAYAKSYAESVSAKKGRRMIAAELKRKGVSDGEIEQALSSLTGEEEGAKRHFEKYMRGKPFDRPTLQKAFRHLLSKGYDYETARAAMRGADDED